MVNSNIRRAQFENAIKCIETKKRGMEVNYLQSVDILEKEVNEIERRIEVTKSKVKKDILWKQHEHLEEVSDRLDKDFEDGLRNVIRSLRSIRPVSRSWKRKSRWRGPLWNSILIVSESIRIIQVLTICLKFWKMLSMH